MAEKDYTVPALQRGLQILEMFTGQTRRLTQAEMADAFGVSLGSLYRIVQTLTNMGYLRRVGANSYELGSQVLSRGFCYLASREISEIAAPYIIKLRDITSLSSHLAIREGRETIYIFRALASQILAVNVPLGMRYPCHTTAMGRILLTGMRADELEALYSGQRIDGYPDPAPQTFPELVELCRKESRQGWSIHFSDYSTALAVPIYDHMNNVVAAINVSVPDAIMKKTGMQERLLDMLKDSASKISQDISGYSREKAHPL